MQIWPDADPKVLIRCAHAISVPELHADGTQLHIWHGSPRWPFAALEPGF